MYPRIVNVVSTFNMNCKFNLKNLTNELFNIEYNPKKFGAAIMKLKSPRSTALIWHTGKIVVAGAASKEESRRSSRRYFKIIKKLGYDVKFSEFKIRNIVATMDMKQYFGRAVSINVEHMARTSPKKNNMNLWSFEPEIFPALICKFSNMKILVFKSAKIIFSGAKNINQLYNAYDYLFPYLITNSIFK